MMNAILKTALDNRRTATADVGEFLKKSLVFHVSPLSGLQGQQFPCCRPKKPPLPSCFLQRLRGEHSSARWKNTVPEARPESASASSAEARTASTGSWKPSTPAAGVVKEEFYNLVSLYAESLVLKKPFTQIPKLQKCRKYFKKPPKHPVSYTDIEIQRNSLS